MSDITTIQSTDLISVSRTTINDNFEALNENKLSTITVGAENATYITDGVADDVQINAAIVAANAAGGGTVFIKEGTYVAVDQIFLKSNVHVTGDGIATVIKMADSAEVQEFISADTITNASLSNLKVDYNHANNTTCTRGMWLQAPSSYVSIRDCTFINCKGFAIGLAGDGSGDVSVRNEYCDVSDNVVDDTITTNNDMILVLSNYGQVHRNKILGFTANGGLVLYESDYITASNNYIEIGNNAAGTAIGVWSCRWGNISDNTIQGTSAGVGNAIQVLTEHDNVTPTTSQYNLISGNTIKGVNTAFSLVETNYDTFSNNKIDSCSKMIDYVAGTAVISPNFRDNKVTNTAGTIGVGTTPTSPYYVGNSIGTADNFGVGTLVPDELIHIAVSDAASPVTLKVQNLDPGGDGEAELFLGTSSTITNVSVGASLYADRTNTGGAGSTDLLIKTSNGTSLNTNVTIKHNGKTGIGVTAPTAIIHLKAGTATANTAPLKLNTGALLTAAEAGAIEFLTDSYYATTTTNAVRRMLVAGNTGRATAQVAANASVATYTLGASDASYEVSANVLVTIATTHAFNVECAYTDEGNTARTVILPLRLVGDTTALTSSVANGNGTVPYNGVSVHIRCKASTAITIRTQAAGTYTTVVYNIEGVIKQIA